MLAWGVMGGKEERGADDILDDAEPAGRHQRFSSAARSAGFLDVQTVSGVFDVTGVGWSALTRDARVSPPTRFAMTRINLLHGTFGWS